MYNSNIRLWRVKVRIEREKKTETTKVTSVFFSHIQSKSKGLSLTCYDLLGTGNLQLIIGWSSGKVRSISPLMCA